MYVLQDEKEKDCSGEEIWGRRIAEEEEHTYMWVGLVLDSDRSLYIVVTIKNLGLNQVVVQVYICAPSSYGQLGLELC